MNTLIGVAAFGLTLVATACSAGPPQTSGPPTSKPAPPAPTGFDDKSNGVAGDPTHQADQAKFEEFEAIPDGLGPLFNAQSCRECHQNPVSGGISQVLELRVGHKGPDGSFQNPDIPINGGSLATQGRPPVKHPPLFPTAALPPTHNHGPGPGSAKIPPSRISVNS